jgi:hypothetical protein
MWLNGMFKKRMLLYQREEFLINVFNKYKVRFKKQKLQQMTIMRHWI